MNKKVLIVNGPNLNMLGTREKSIYGSETLEDIKKSCETKAKELSIKILFEQSNVEGELVTIIQNAKKTCDAIIINAAAYTHTSVAIRDALLSTDLPVIEVHLSNIYKREDFRHKSLISDIAEGVICGFGAKVYTMALETIK
tara:strand:- start:3574 stop:3999 length:426 start_codon:yes stop_codon:yes gene_type:complete